MSARLMDTFMRLTQTALKSDLFLARDFVPFCPAVGPDGTVYVGSHDNYLYAINQALHGSWVALGPLVFDR